MTRWVNIGGALGPLFAGWAHRHLGVENVYRGRDQRLCHVFWWLSFFFGTGKAGDAGGLRLRSRRCAEFLRGRRKLPSSSAGVAGRIGCCGLGCSSIRSTPCLGGLCALLVLVLVGISRFMWFLVLFTGYWVVFGQYISLPGYIHGYINSSAAVETILVTDGLTVICPHARSELFDPQDASISGGDSGTVVHFSVVVISGAAAHGLGAVLSLFVLALGEIIQAAPRYYEYIYALASREPGHLHGLCFSAHRNWIADGGMVWRRLRPPLREKSRTTGAHLVDGTAVGLATAAVL